MSYTHKFSVGDKVIFTNDFGVCWGIKIITALDTRTYDMWGEPITKPTYHYEGTDTPWFSVDEENFTAPDQDDLILYEWQRLHKGEALVAEFFQNKYGFTPTTDQLGGCY